MTSQAVIDDDEYDEYVEYGGDDERDRVLACPTCNGQGWGFVGTDWDSDDPINGPYDGESETCWNCHGSGRAKDCWLW